ncbi:sensor histidine kinase [Geodermatophilus sp. FMUSA9-8]|uniref:sensor histidine kinase n=1 Tax=Geodermatophilus sp. FMUSA9-8 TaxID=3120155 RepID=UPI003009ECAC
MSVQQSETPTARRIDAPGAAGVVFRAAGSGLAAVRRLVGGLGTALLAVLVVVVVVVTSVLCLLGVGLLGVPAALRAVRAVADLERARLGREGPEIVLPGPARNGLRAAVAEATTRRELGWLGWQATGGLLLGLVGALLPVLATRDLLFPLYWWLLPDGPTSTSLGWGTADGWSDVIAPVLLGVGWVAVMVGLSPGMARVQAAPGRRLLPPGPEVDLSLRVAQLTATRAAALDAHAAELRRIERSLHDGTQNRLVAATVLLGAARRAVDRDDSATARELLERAHSANEQALEELRAVARSILPPVLANRGLAGALTGLAATCPVPCSLDLDPLLDHGRCVASVEATAYFVVAEALTNTAKHARAGRVEVTVRRLGERLSVRIVDDGRGGADGVDDAAGSGLAGVRRRVEAHDGTLTVTSPLGGPTVVEVELPCGS